MEERQTAILLRKRGGRAEGGMERTDRKIKRRALVTDSSQVTLTKTEAGKGRLNQQDGGRREKKTTV